MEQKELSRELKRGCMQEMTVRNEKKRNERVHARDESKHGSCKEIGQCEER